MLPQPTLSLPEMLPQCGDPDVLCTEIVWRVSHISAKIKELPKGNSVWSPEFTAGGIRGMQIEFFPNGRESATMHGYCSVFFWCPDGTSIKYQVQVGQSLRAPDEDTFETRMGHGHSNFCLLAPEIDLAEDSVTIRVEILDVEKRISFGSGLEVCRPPLCRMMNRFVSVVANKSINRIEWKIENMSKRIVHLPKGASLYSPVFSAAGIRDILVEFYPNGNVTTSRDGYCALYLRCPEGTQVIVTLSIGEVRRGPITAKFEGNAGKGLPEFCQLAPQIDQATDSILVALDLKNPLLESARAHVLTL